MVHGQKEGVSTIVEYEYFDDSFTSLEKLLVNNSKAVYMRQPNSSAEKTGEIIKKGDDYTLPTVNYMTGKHMYFSSLKDKYMMISTMAVNGKPYVVKDSTIVFNWTIDNNTKKTINDFECVKATTSFRGRHFIAYFSPQIPIPFGPYKFSGLPGLILEISNQENDNLHRWVAVKIETIDKAKQNIQMPDLYSIKSPRINMFDFQNINKDLRSEKMRAEQARLPVGVTMNSTITNLSIELLFEWDKPEIKK